MNQFQPARFCMLYLTTAPLIIIIVLVMIIINNIPAPFPCKWLFLFTTSTKPLNSRHKKSSLLNRALHIHMPGGTWLCMCDLVYETFAGDTILYNPIPRAFLVDYRWEKLKNENLLFSCFANRASNFVLQNLSTYEIAHSCPKYYSWCCWWRWRLWWWC